MNTLEIHEYHNFGYLKAKIPNEVRDVLLDEVTSIQNNFELATPRNEFLAGHIKHEYSLFTCVDVLEKYIIDLAYAYDNHYGYFKQIDILTKNLPMAMKHPWVNFQSKHEFNPNHNHKGMLSFVIWLKIPYDLKDEQEYGPGTLGEKSIASQFQFLYVNSLGQIATHQIPVDKTFENTVILFPAKMIHCVYPFYTSNDYRISVAGNIMLDVK